MSQKYTTTSFRMPEDIQNYMNKLQTINPELKMQKIIMNALNEYLKKELELSENAYEQIKEFEDDINIEDYMLIPLQHYATFNGLTTVEVSQKIKRKEIKTLIFGDVTLILIDINEKIYKQSELMTIKSNVSNVVKNNHELKKAISALRRRIEALENKEK